MFVGDKSFHLWGKQVFDIPSRSRPKCRLLMSHYEPEKIWHYQLCLLVGVKYFHLWGKYVVDIPPRTWPFRLMFHYNLTKIQDTTLSRSEAGLMSPFDVTLLTYKEKVIPRMLNSIFYHLPQWTISVVLVVYFGNIWKSKSFKPGVLFLSNPSKNVIRKIPHTGDTESVDQCG